ncbi:hypothetical protein [Nonomuraea sp. NPDC049784]|uniref:hypothetical protein n=1 Tax=Nonomuraea sp. NPDC049784 TaxID=3154361 RepID=UPI0033DDB19F
MTTTPTPQTHGWAVADDDPFVTPEQLPDGVDPTILSRFGDPWWNLSPLNPQGHSPACCIHWDRFPEALRPAMRRAAWAAINFPTPQELLEGKGGRRVKWPSPSTLHKYVSGWARFSDWLTARGISELQQVNEDDLEDYAYHIAQLARSGHGVNELMTISLLWGLAPHLPDYDRLIRPPWEGDGTIRDYLPALNREDDTTKAIHPAVMSPLLIWSLRFIQDFAEDILTGWQEYQRIEKQIRIQTKPDGFQRAVDLINSYLAEDRPLPGHTTYGRLFTAQRYLAGMAQATPIQIKNAIVKARREGAVAALGQEAPLEVSIRGRIHEQPWRSHIDYYQAPTLVRRLATAAMIVILYLSGMRAAECLLLEVGCCPEPEASNDAGPVRYKIYGNVIKGVRDHNGRSIPGGKPRDLPWAVIPPVVDAIRILERLTGSRWLFPLKTKWNKQIARGERKRKGELLTAEGANVRIQDFIAEVNQLADQLGLAAERIPDDPDGRIVVSRFRNTVAWHIARLPGGRIALAIQYGHLRASGVTDGYSSQARRGLRRILNVETARAMADYLDDVAERLNDGEGVSGPAALRMIKAARDAKIRFEGMFLSPRDADDLLEEPQFHVYDNPEAFLTCNHDPAKALCHPERTGRAPRDLPPAIDRCDPACANIARTDTHIEALQREVAQLEAEIADPLTPVPLRERLKQRVGTLRAIVARHHRTRMVAASPDRIEENKREPER